MTDYSPYGVTHHADADRMTADAMVGERLGAGSGNATVGSPAIFSTAPYRPPNTYGPKPPVTHGCVGRNSTCRVPCLTGTDMCLFHTKQAQAAARRGEDHRPPDPA